MDVAAMARDGIEGGFHKLTDGLNYYVDPYFATAIARMRGNLGFYGPYHVLWGNRDIVGQANWLVSILDQQYPWWRTDPRFRIMSDDEKFSYNVQPSIAQINQFHDVINSHRVTTQAAYAPHWVYNGAETGIRYLVVGSNYGSNPAVHYPVGYPGDSSSRWGLGNGVLQYGSMLVMGTQSQTDCNAVRDEAIWQQLVNGAIDMTQAEHDFLYALGYRMAGLVKGADRTSTDAANPVPNEDLMPFWNRVAKAVIELTDAQVTDMANQIAAKLPEGATVEEIKAIINGTKLVAA
jgi:hypothetical protein